MNTNLTDYDCYVKFGNGFGDGYGNGDGYGFGYGDGDGRSFKDLKAFKDEY